MEKFPPHRPGEPRHQPPAHPQRENCNPTTISESDHELLRELKIESKLPRHTIHS
ncbi:hypothetical protein H6F32_12830 [Anabaena sp. FACHB-1237]|uniref:hypothetical protein n=1 Tax=Anabaena sp. FACHB-1237 TaxID=2692769 RepID=UPI001680339D|nr:hypothetical protein [Anabaena sp. FACHB-1237]MBD2138453.1 hypothetical protein [Anabaena sp. FACHB-1237]